MAKQPPIPDELRRRAVAAVAAAWQAGCPVAGSRPELQAAAAEVCLRRYRSLARRNVDSADRPAQIKDLARGMVEAFGPEKKLVGPQIRDYEWLAEQVLVAISG